MNKCYIVGSRGRIKYKKELCDLINKIGSDTLKKLINFDVVKNDYDSLYIGDYNDVVNKYNDYIIYKKSDMLKLKINNAYYDVYISTKKTKYFYFLFLIMGKIPTIILRQKAKRNGLKLNRYGLYYRENLRKVPLRFYDNKNMFENIFIIINYIYKL